MQVYSTPIAMKMVHPIDVRKTRQEIEFSEVLNETVRANQIEAAPNAFSKKNTSLNKDISHQEIPDWVNQDYRYELDNPRRPNMRELSEAIAGKTMEEIYQLPNDEWKAITRKAQDLLDGVLSDARDTRDWNKIMSADNVVAKAQEETFALHRPYIGVHNLYDETGALETQSIVIKNSAGQIVASLSDDLEKTQNMLRNFGIMNVRESISRLELNDLKHNSLHEKLLKYLDAHNA